MSLEKIFLYLTIALAGVWLLLLIASSIALLSVSMTGLISLAVAVFISYVLFRLVREHRDNPEDRYYEDNFDR